MEELIPMNEFGLLADKTGEARVDSRFVAKAFGKNHKDVLKAIRKIIGEDSGYSEEFSRRNFAPVKYKDAKGENRPCYLLTRDGFTALTFGFTGKKADHFKEWYINRFNEMEQQVDALNAARMDFPRLTEAIQMSKESPKPYDYSNECDMINKLVTGKRARDIRKEHDLKKDESIRPYLSEAQLNMIDKLQFYDAGLLVAIPDFQKRKETLRGVLMNQGWPMIEAAK